jgi:carbamoyltransferase
VEEYLRLIKERMVSVKEDGSIYMNQAWFNYAAGLVMTNDRAWERLFGFPPRAPEGPIEQRHCDLGLAIQRLTEEIVLKMAAEAKRLTGLDNLCLAGGVALNCVANGKLLRSGPFKNIWIQPAAGDAGGALGAALAAHHIYFGEAREPAPGAGDAMKGALLGPEFSDGQIEEAAARLKAPYTKYDTAALCAETAGRLASGQVGGWFQGRMEWGPRSLGNRSILADPRDAAMQKRLNLKIKFREGFRPFAPSVQAERAGEYFDQAGPSPYMLLTAGVAERRRNALPAGWEALTMDQRLYFPRSDMPAVTHLDYSARVQTVHRETNPRYWDLLEAFRARTGCAALVNTSFNVRGEPIVHAPEEAYACFMRTGMDFLVLGNLIFDKKEQPAWNS